MGINVGGMITEISANAEGVKQGVAIAQAELKKLDNVKDIKLSVESTSVQTIVTYLEQIIDLLTEIHKKTDQLNESGGFWGWVGNLAGVATIVSTLKDLYKCLEISKGIMKFIPLLGTGIRGLATDLALLGSQAEPLGILVFGAKNMIMEGMQAAEAAKGWEKYQENLSGLADEKKRYNDLMRHAATADTVSEFVKEMQAIEDLKQKVLDFNEALLVGGDSNLRVDDMLSKYNIEWSTLGEDKKAEAIRMLGDEYDKLAVRISSYNDVKIYQDLISQSITSDNAAEYQKEAERIEDLAAKLEVLKKQVSGNEMLPEDKAAFAALTLEMTRYGFAYDSTVDRQKNLINATQAMEEAFRNVNKPLGEYNAVLAEFDRAERLAKTQKDYTERTNELSSAYKKLADGQSLSYDETMKLVDGNETLAERVKQNGKLTKDDMELIKKAAELKKEAHIQNLEALITEQKIVEQNAEDSKSAIIAKYMDQLSLATEYGGRLVAIAQYVSSEETTALDKVAENARENIRKLEAQLELAKNDNPFADTGSGGNAPKDTRSENDKVKEAYAKERKIHDDKKEMLGMSEEEELASLAVLRENYKGHTDIYKKLTKEMYDADRVSYENRVSLAKMSAGEEIDALEVLLDKYRDSAEIAKELHTEIFEKKGSVADGQLEVKREEVDKKKIGYGFIDEAEQAEYIEILRAYLADGLEIYSGFDDKRVQFAKDANAEIIAEEAKLANMSLTALTKGTDDRIAEYEREMSVKKSKVGIAENGVEFTYGSADEAKDFQKIIDENERMINVLLSLGRELTEEELIANEKMLTSEEHNFGFLCCA